MLKTGVENEGEKAVANSRCHTQSGQEMDRIRLCDIGRRNIGPTVRSVDRVLENSSEVGEKADYPVYHQPCKKETDEGFMNVYSHWLSPLSFVLALQVTTTTILHLLPFLSLLSSLPPLSLVP